MEGILNREQFYREAAKCHLSRDWCRIDEIFNRFDFPTNINQYASDHIEFYLHSTFIYNDCAKLVMTYLGIFFQSNNYYMESNEILDHFIVTETTASCTRSCHWLINSAKEIGVINAMIDTIHKNHGLIHATNEFVTLGLGVAKYYGFNVFEKMLKFFAHPEQSLTAVVIIELINVVAQSAKIIPTMCMLGPFYCECFKQNLRIYEDFITMQKKSYLQEDSKKNARKQIHQKYSIFFVFHDKDDRLDTLLF